jgi:acyl-homoserine lactone synthase
MAIVVVAENAKAHERELELAFKFRHAFFVEDLGWEALRKPDGREIDAFDTRDTVHIIELADDNVVFYARLVPSLKPHLLSHVYPELLQGHEEPTGPDIWEASRGTLFTRRLPDGQPNPLAGRQTLAAVETALFVGAHYLHMQIPTDHLGRLHDHGYRPRALAPPVVYKGSELVAVLSTVDATTLETTRNIYGIRAPVATFDGVPVLDLARPPAA